MEKETLFLTSSVVELADEEDKPYIVLTNRLCWYGEPNLNNVILPVENAAEYAQTLVDMPVQAKYKKIANKDDLGGHEVRKDPKTGEIVFGTESVGTHVFAEVKDDEVVVNGREKTLPCLFATSKVWKRYKNVVSAIKRLFNEGKLHTSWEVEYTKSTDEDGYKTLNEYRFIGNALLGSTTPPAYPCAETLAVASAETDDISEAVALDVADSKEETVDNTVNENTVVEPAVEPASEPETTEPIVTEPEGAEPQPETAETQPEATGEPETSAEPEGAEPEQASLTVRDIYCGIHDALRAAYPDSWYEIICLLPEEHIAWCHDWDAEHENEVDVFHYEVVDNHINLVGEPEHGELTVSVSQVNAELSKRDAAVAEAAARIQALESEVETLKPYKAEADRTAAEKAKAEKEQKQGELAAYAIRSKFITKSEVEEGGALYSCIAELNKAGIDAVIAERYMAGVKPEQETKYTNEYASVDIDGGESNKANINALQIYLSK